MTRTINGSNFKKNIIENKSLSIVKFEAEWNGSCQIVAPIFEDLASSYKDVINFYKIDIEEERVIAYEYCIMDLPTILFFQDGQVIDHVSGLTSKNILKEKIETALTAVKN